MGYFQRGRKLVAVKKGCLACKACKGKECTECHRVRMNAWRAKKVKEGFCSHCCNTPPVPGKKVCGKCVLRACLGISFKGRPEEAEKARVAIELFNGICQCCGKIIAASSKPHIEHDHDTGKFRGIVCPSCNLIMGMAKDSIEHLNSVIRYLTTPLRCDMIGNV